jgi:hypothetical protein
VRVPVALLLMVLLPGATRAQKRPCEVTAGVQMIEPASLPEKAFVSSFFSKWLAQHRDPRMMLEYQDISAFYDDLPYNYTVAPLWVPVKGLPPEAFVAIERKRLIPVLSGEPRSGPLRIVFVVENGRRLTAAQRQVEAAALKAILSASRRDDSFALFSTAAPRISVPFGSSRQAIELALERLREPRQKGPKDDGVSSALLEAARFFGRPQGGDAIILLARTVDGSRRVEVLSALTMRGIRLFSLALDAMVEADWSVSLRLVNPLATLSEETGGGWEQAGPLPRKDRATDTELHVARRYARKLYEMATTYYVLRLEHTGPHVVIGLSPHMLDQTPWGRVVYPKPLPVCP